MSGRPSTACLREAFLRWLKPSSLGQLRQSRSYALAAGRARQAHRVASPRAVRLSGVRGHKLQVFPMNRPGRPLCRTFHVKPTCSVCHAFQRTLAPRLHVQLLSLDIRVLGPGKCGRLPRSSLRTELAFPSHTVDPCERELLQRTAVKTAMAADARMERDRMMPCGFRNISCTGGAVFCQPACRSVTGEPAVCPQHEGIRFECLQGAGGNVSRGTRDLCHRNWQGARCF